MAAVPLNQRQLSSARVQLVDGRQLTILQPRVLGDSLTGYRDSVAPGPASSHPAITSVAVAVPMAQVGSVESRHLNGWKTAGVSFALVVLLVLGVGNAMSPFP